MDFEAFFRRVTNGLTPLDWQRNLAAPDACTNQTIRIPTGFGKTLGVLGAWLWHRVEVDDDRWPRRLVWCLPMRVLAEQTEAAARVALASIERLWNDEDAHEGKVGVHVLMGGADAGEWHLHPEHGAVLIGTQDMLLSRALNRGYAAPRARWPMELGLLNQDCLWVMDEVQLMDVGLATSAQLQAFRDDDQNKRIRLRPNATWWMSATLQAGWLARSPDTIQMAAALGTVSIGPDQRKGHLWDDVSKPCRFTALTSAKGIGRLVGDEHLRRGRGTAGPTLVVLNRVDTAVAVWESLRQDKRLGATDIRLVHSRFRPAERATWGREFLNRDACVPGTDRIVVATQVIEAGLDFSAAVLVSELAPWASLVQRFGRCARWGGEAAVIVLDLAPKDDKAAAPYSKVELDAARSAFAALAASSGLHQAEDTAPVADVAPLALERFEESHGHLLDDLYPYDPAQLLLRHELDDLFDTTPDLSGADVDISRFIRSGEERDLHVFWAALTKGKGRQRISNRLATGSAPCPSSGRGSGCARPSPKVSRRASVPGFGTGRMVSGSRRLAAICSPAGLFWSPRIAGDTTSDADSGLGAAPSLRWRPIRYRPMSWRTIVRTTRHCRPTTGRPSPPMAERRERRRGPLPPGWFRTSRPSWTWAVAITTSARSTRPLEDRSRAMAPFHPGPIGPRPRGPPGCRPGGSTPCRMEHAAPGSATSWPAPWHCSAS
jgi:hypothetical protein